MQLVGYLRFNYTQLEFLDQLEDLVRTGRGCDFHQTMTRPEQWRDYQLGMLEIARLEARVVTPRIPVRRSAVRLLDVAGSHGLFGAALCRRHAPSAARCLNCRKRYRMRRNSPRMSDCSTLSPIGPGMR